MKWINKKAVMFGSNFQRRDLVGTVVRKKKNGEKESFQCPIIVKNYNSNMGFVDKAYQLKTTYQINTKSRKWWH